MNSHDQNFIAEKIRTQYIKEESSKLDALVELDKKVKRPAEILAYVTGTLGALVMGSGMSLVMTEIGTALGIAATTVPGIVTGVIGLALVVLNYPLYKRVLAARRKKHTNEILQLSQEITQEAQSNEGPAASENSEN